MIHVDAKTVTYAAKSKLTVVEKPSVAVRLVNALVSSATCSGASGKAHVGKKLLKLIPRSIEQAIKANM